MAVNLPCTHTTPFIQASPSPSHTRGTVPPAITADNSERAAG